MQIKRLACSLLIALPLATGCRSDDTLNPPPAPPVPSGGALFQRYVSMGNSITAGFQSAGINDSTQKRSYAVLLASAMGASFTYPSLAGGGCPAPFTNNVTQARVPTGSATGCDARVSNIVPNNVAVPGARAEEILNNLGVPTSNSNALTLLFLGGKTQIERMEEQSPTFVSLWIGANDVLGAFTTLPDTALLDTDPLQENPGDITKITSLGAFTAQYDSILEVIDSTGAKAVLLGVPDVTVIPYASLGAFYFCLKNGGCPPPLPAALPQLAFPNFKVAATCAPAPVPGGLGLSTLVPWPVGLTAVQRALARFLAADTTSIVLDCANDKQVVTAVEITALKTAVAGYNTYIQTEAAARGWGFVDVNATLTAELQLSPTFVYNPAGRIPAFPNALPAFNNPPGSVTFQVVSPAVLPALFTLDGVHPSALAHQLIADSVASVINATYGTTLPVPVCGTVNCPLP